MTEQERKEIEMCLSCPLPDCVDCLGRPSRKGLAKKVHRASEVKRMSALGMSDKEMGTILGIHANTVLLIRRELGIPNQRARMMDARRGEA